MKKKTKSKKVKKYFSHKSAVIDPRAEVGANVQVWHFSHVRKGARIGEGSKLGQNVFVGPSVVFTNVRRSRSEFPKKIEEYDKTYVKKGATLGANSTIVAGITIGEYAFVAAGSVVTQNVPPYTQVMGVPARVCGKVARDGTPAAMIL